MDVIFEKSCRPCKGTGVNLRAFNYQCGACDGTGRISLVLSIEIVQGKVKNASFKCTCGHWVLRPQGEE